MAQSEASSPKPIPPAPQGNPVAAISSQGAGPSGLGNLITHDLAIYIQEASAPSSGSSGQESLAGVDLREQEMSEDEDLAPDQPAFVGLFKPQLFHSLLHKAKATTGLGISRLSATDPGEGVSSSAPLFEEPTIETEEIPGCSPVTMVLSHFGP